MQQYNGRYQIQSTIGHGSMGVVFQATDRLSKETIALKQVQIPIQHLQFSPSIMSPRQSNLNKTLAQEFQILAGLRHPNIISVLDFGFSEKKEPFFTMPYLHNATTVSKVAPSMNTGEKLRLIQQILSALAYLHRRRILHRDIKPSNVLVHNNNAFLLDFGLSISLEQKTKTIAGSLLYMAPELFKTQTSTAQSDLYSVGIMMYEMFAKQHPYYDEKSPLHSQIETPPKRFSGVDEVLWAFIKKLIAHEPEERFSSAKKCLDTLNQIIGDANKVTVEDRESYLRAARFIGREKILSELHGALQKAQKGNSSAWLLGGESGVGKTRLVEQVRIHALISGWQVIVGQATIDVGRPYELWQEVVPNLVLNSKIKGSQFNSLSSTFPVLTRILDQEKVETYQGTVDQGRLIGLLSILLQNQTRPTLLVFEDLQWAREGLTVLEQILLMVDSFPNIMLMATYRDDDQPNLPDQLPKMKEVKIGRFSKPEIDKLNRAMLGEQAIAPDFLAWVIKETEGNAFFVVEVIRAVAEHLGSLDRVGKQTFPKGIMTSGMQTLLARRLQNLSQADLSLVNFTAVAGRKVDVSLINQSVDTNSVQAWLHRMTDAAIFMAQEKQWQFSHDKLREMILAQLPDVQKSQLHQRVAETIEAVYPQNHLFYADLLEHWHRAGSLEKELFYLQPVADALIERMNRHAEAEALLERGLDQLPQGDSRQLPLLVLLARSYQRKGHFSEAETIVTVAKQLAEQVDDRQNLQKTLYILGLINISLQKYDKARAYLDRGITIQADHLEIRWQTKLYGAFGHLERIVRNFDKSVKYYLQSLQLSRKINDQDQIVLTYNDLGILELLRGEIDNSIGYFETCRKIAKSTGFQHGLRQALSNLGAIEMTRQNYDKAESYLNESIMIAKANGSEMYSVLAHYSLGCVMFRKGEFAEARRFALEGTAIRKKYNIQLKYRQFQIAEGFVHLRLRETDEALFQFWRVLDEGYAENKTAYLAWALVGFAWFFYENGAFYRAAELINWADDRIANFWVDDLPKLLAKVLTEDEMAAAKAHSKARSIEGTAKEIIEEFSYIVDAIDLGNESFDDD